MPDPVRSALVAALGRQRAGHVRLIEGGRTTELGCGGDLECTVEVREPSVWRRALRGGTGIGEAYMDGAFVTDDLVSLLRILLRALRRPFDVADRASRMVSPVSTALRRLRPRTKSQDAADVRAHYDLSNEFFELFLDETMTYSCAVFDRPDMTLAEAQTEKIDRLCRRLELEEGQRLVEIGSGWGALAVHAATRYGVHVTTTTLSDRQYEHVKQRVGDLGLTDRIDVLHSDYRDLRGTYDALVSVEMIEAVDWRQHNEFFGACSRLLEPHGAMALQAILHRDQHYPRAMHSMHWVKKYIFPGGLLPSVGAISKALAAHTDMRMVWLQDIGLHYARTLRLWRERFNEKIDEVRALGFADRFLRMWDFYLASCRAAFLERHIYDAQMILAKPDWPSEPALT